MIFMNWYLCSLRIDTNFSFFDPVTRLAQRATEAEVVVERTTKTRHCLGSQRGGRGQGGGRGLGRYSGRCEHL